MTEEYKTERTRKSIFEHSGLPKEFGVILLTFGLILCVSPYMPGKNLDIFSVPNFEPKIQKRLKVIDPPIFGAIVLLFLPIWKDGNDETASDLIPSIPWDDQVSNLHLSQIKQINKIILSLNIKRTEMKRKINDIDNRRKGLYNQFARNLDDLDDLEKTISQLEKLRVYHVKEYYIQLKRTVSQPVDEYIRGMKN